MNMAQAHILLISRALLTIFNEDTAVQQVIGHAMILSSIWLNVLVLTVRVKGLNQLP